MDGHKEYVIEFEKELSLSNGHKVKSVLLQYDVEYPYRICDAAFMSQDHIRMEVKKWEEMNNRGYDKTRMIAANVLIRILRIRESKSFFLT